MARIEVKGQTIQLKLPESSTVLIIPGTPSSQQVARHEQPQEPAIESAFVLALIRDYKDFGSEDIDENGNFTRLSKKLRQLRDQGISCHRFLNQLDGIIDETRLRQEGRRIGSLPQAMTDVKQLLTELAEDIWTESTSTAA